MVCFCQNKKTCQIALDLREVPNTENMEELLPTWLSLEDLETQMSPPVLVLPLLPAAPVSPPLLITVLVWWKLVLAVHWSCTAHPVQCSLWVRDDGDLPVTSHLPHLVSEVPVK